MIDALAWTSRQGDVGLQTEVLAMLRRLRPYRAVGPEKVRLGSPNDGGYVMLDDFSGIVAALSFGIEQNAAWDIEIANRGVRVLQFDHTINAPPIRDSRLIWEKKKIAPSRGESTESIVSIVDALPVAAKPT